MKTTIAAKTRVAHKPHTCCVCRAPIPVGKRYEYSFSLEDGEAIFERTCLVCVVNRTAYAHHCGDDGDYNAELRRQINADAEKWEASNEIR